MRSALIETVSLNPYVACQQRRDWLVITYVKHESAVEAIRAMHGHLLNDYKMVLTFYVQVSSCSVSSFMLIRPCLLTIWCRVTRVRRTQNHLRQILVRKPVL